MISAGMGVGHAMRIQGRRNLGMYLADDWGWRKGWGGGERETMQGFPFGSVNERAARPKLPCLSSVNRRKA